MKAETMKAVSMDRLNTFFLEEGEKWWSLRSKGEGLMVKEKSGELGDEGGLE